MEKVNIDKKKIKKIFYNNLIQLNDYLESGKLYSKKVGQLIQDTANILIFNNPFEKTKLPDINDFLPIGLKTNLSNLKINADNTRRHSECAVFIPMDNEINIYQTNLNDIVSFLEDIAHEYTHFIQHQIIEYVIDHPDVELDEKLNNVIEDSVFQTSDNFILCDFVRLYKKINFQNFDISNYNNEKATEKNFKHIVNEVIYFQFFHEEQARDCSYNFVADIYNEMQLDKDCPDELKDILDIYYDDFLIEQNADLEYRKSPTYIKLRKLYHECCDAISKFPVNRIAKIKNETLKNDVGNLKLHTLRKNKASAKEFIGTLCSLNIDPSPYNNLFIKMIDTQNAYLEFMKTYNKAGELEVANLFNNTMLNIDTFEDAKYSSNEQIYDVCKYWLKSGNYNNLFYMMKIINEVENPIYSPEVAKRIIDFRDTLLSDKSFVDTINKRFSKIENLIDGEKPINKTDVRLLKQCKNISYIHRSLQAPPISQQEEESQKQYYYNINTLAQDLVANYHNTSKGSAEKMQEVEVKAENQVSNQES